MREIKFRAWEYAHQQESGDGWRKSPMVWRMNYSPAIEGSETLYEGDRVNLNEALANGGMADYDIEHKSIFMQYTGLLDKNGREIYEGDIVTTPWCDDYEEMPHTIGFEDGCFYAGNHFLHEHEVEVIGNIHENPELLKPKGSEE